MSFLNDWTKFSLLLRVSIFKLYYALVGSGQLLGYFSCSPYATKPIEIFCVDTRKEFLLIYRYNFLNSWGLPFSGRVDFGPYHQFLDPSILLVRLRLIKQNCTQKRNPPSISCYRAPISYKRSFKFSKLLLPVVDVLLVEFTGAAAHYRISI